MVKPAVAFWFAAKWMTVGLIVYCGQPIAKHDTGGLRVTFP